MSTPPSGPSDPGEHTRDVGLFGPDSVSWRVWAQPTMAMAGLAAASIQMLHPRLMWMIDQASSFRARPELRARRTNEYMATVIYGDVATAEQAAETLRRVHQGCIAVDPNTGESYTADTPELLLWVHCAMVWATLRAFEQYGLGVDPDERETYLTEQRVFARLVGVDESMLPGSVSELEEYMTSMLPRLALTPPGLWYRDMVLTTGPTLSPSEAMKRMFVRGAVVLMADEHRRLFGLRWGHIRDSLVRANVQAALVPLSSRLDQVIPQMREFVDENAFGFKKHRVGDEPHHSDTPSSAAA